ncbi:sensor histidine kinase [Fluviicola sp.]|uniref:sensor histidine kinase n=1 Tax=Fluviicola sp. TaxID=1917219 RepID=UPI003D2D0844
MSVLLICFSIQLNGQELYGKYLGTERGLLSKECYDINFNKEGYLIVGTQYGPMKYDGEKFISICQNLPIEQRIMYDFEKDPKGETYMLNSKNELYILKRDKAIRIDSKKSKPISVQIRFKKLHWVSNGLMIFSNNVYFQYQFKNHLISPCSKVTKELKNAFIFDPAKEFPFKKRMSEERTVPTHTIQFKSLQKTIHVKEHIISESREDFLKIGNNQFAIISSQLYRIDSTKVEILPYEDILFMEAFHDRIWLATVNGLIELDKNGNWIHTHFHGQVIGGVAPLPQEGIAVSLNQYGVFICSNIHERFYENIMPSYVANHNQTTIVGNRLGQIFHLKHTQLTKIHEAIKLSEDIRINLRNIRRIEFIKDKWYICSIKGIYSLSHDLKERKKILIDEYYSFNDFFLSKGQLYSISWSSITSFQDSEKQVIAPVTRCRHQINDSAVMLGTEEGLFNLHVPSQKLIRTKFFPELHYISHIEELSPNEFLITSRYKGIFLFKNGSLLKKYESPCVSLKKALFYKGKIFAAGNQGIYTKNIRTNREKPWNKIFDKEIQNLFLIKGKLFICADDNLIIKEITSKNESRNPLILLNEILIGEQKIKKIPQEIDYNVPISLDFDILKFSANKLRLYYRLKGERKINKQTEGTKINFESLPSGDYDLELFPVIDGKIQFSNSKNYRFRINQPFWETTFFYVLISIVLLLILLSFRLIRNLQRKKRVAERAELESKLNAYKLLAVKAQVNPHFLSNGLAAIQALILKGDNDNAAHYLAKFSYLMRKILYYSETQFISVKQELQLIDAYLELELLRFRNRFEIRKEIDLTKSQLNEFNFPSLLLQPIFENAIWHGLKFQENNPQLLISFKINQNQDLEVLINDNGPGFNLSNQNEEHLSKGNKLISERIDAINKQFQKQVASMEVISSDSGTKVIFIFSPQLYQSNPI